MSVPKCLLAAVAPVAPSPHNPSSPSRLWKHLLRPGVCRAESPRAVSWYVGMFAWEGSGKKKKKTKLLAIL